MTIPPSRLSRPARLLHPRLLPRLLAGLTLALALVFPTFLRRAFAYTPPPIAGMVNDPGNQLSATEKAALNAKLDGHLKTKGHHIVVFLPKSLDGETIEDVAYTTFNTWKVGAAGADNGVLLVIATADRKARIETGKGVGGDLPDLKTNQILRTDVTPNMKVGKVYAAVDQGTNSIISALGGTPGAGVGTKAKPGQPYPFDTKPYGKKSSSTSGGPGCCGVVVVALIIVVVILVLWLMMRRGGGGGGSSHGGGGGFYYGGGGSSGGSDWGSGGGGSDWGSGGGGSDWGSSGGGDSGGGGSDYGGGGGDSGGGGSSDSW